MSTARQVCNAVKHITENPCELSKIGGVYHWVDNIAKTRFYSTATAWSAVNEATIDQWVADYLEKLDASYGVYKGFTDAPCHTDKQSMSYIARKRYREREELAMSNHKSIPMVCVKCHCTFNVLEDEKSYLCVPCFKQYDEDYSHMVKLVRIVVAAEDEVRVAINTHDIDRQDKTLDIMNKAEASLASLYRKLAKLEDIVWAVDELIKDKKRTEKDLIG